MKKISLQQLRNFVEISKWGILIKPNDYRWAQNQKENSISQFYVANSELCFLRYSLIVDGKNPIIGNELVTHNNEVIWEQQFIASLHENVSDVFNFICQNVQYQLRVNPKADKVFRGFLGDPVGAEKRNILLKDGKYYNFLQPGYDDAFFYKGEECVKVEEKIVFETHYHGVCFLNK